MKEKQAVEKSSETSVATQVQERNLKVAKMRMVRCGYVWFDKER